VIGGGGAGGGGFRPTVKKPAKKPKPAAGMEDEGFGAPGPRAKTPRGRRGGAAGVSAPPGMEDMSAPGMAPPAGGRAKPARRKPAAFGS